MVVTNAYLSYGVSGYVRSNMDLLIDFILGISVLGWVLNLTKLLRRSDVPTEYNLDFEFENASGRAHDSDAETNYPSLSVLIPARDEVINIEEALTHALAIKWPNDLEVIVVDDRSTDGTSELLAELATNEPRLRIIQGQEPSAGWLGKPHALYIGEQNAKGDLLLFLDADVRVAPDGLLKTWHRMLKDGDGMVSVLGKLETGSFFEHVIQPRVGAILLGGNPLGLVNDQSQNVFWLQVNFSCLIGQHITVSVVTRIVTASSMTSIWRQRPNKRRRISTLFRICFQVSHVQRSWRNLVRLVEKSFSCDALCLLSTALVVLLVSLWTWVPFLG